MAIVVKKRSILPGFGLTLGFTLLYLSLIVLIPLSATFLKAATLTWPRFWHIVTDPRALASQLQHGRAVEPHQISEEVVQLHAPSLSAL